VNLKLLAFLKVLEVYQKIFLSRKINSAPSGVRGNVLPMLGFYFLCKKMIDKIYVEKVQMWHKHFDFIFKFYM